MLMLRAQFAGRLVASEVWNQLFPKGTWHGENLRPVGGSITIDDAMLAEMVENWRAAGSPPLPVYKTHAHLDEDVSALERAELSKAYGYLTDFRITAEGLEAKTEWTPAGKRMVEEGEFAFWSPEWQPKHRDRRTGDVKGWWLSATALCSNPFFDTMPQLAAHEMPPVAASADDAEEKSTEPTNKKEQDMDKKRICAALGIKEECSDEEVMAAIEAACKMRASAAAESEKLTAAVKAASEPLQAQLAEAKAESEKLKASLLERDVDALVATAKRGDGKMGRAINDMLVATAKKLAASEGVKAAEAFLEALPLSVPLAPQGVAGKSEEVLTAASAKEKLDAIADANIAAGMKRFEAMEAAIRTNPELARAAQKLTNPTPKSV